MNKIMLIGRLGKDPEMTYTQNGRAVTKFTMAVSRRWKDRDSGEQREETTWFNIVAWERLAETMNEYLRKGSRAFIEGRMTSRKYTDKDGNERTAWEIIANDMEMLETKAESQARAGHGASDMSNGDVDAEDIPF
jgi:single-strand DNA-binding protein